MSGRINQQDVLFVVCHIAVFICNLFILYVTLFQMSYVDAIIKEKNGISYVNFKIETRRIKETLTVPIVLTTLIDLTVLSSKKFSTRGV